MIVLIPSQNLWGRPVGIVPRALTGYSVSTIVSAIRRRKIVPRYVVLNVVLTRPLTIAGANVRILRSPSQETSWLKIDKINTVVAAAMWQRLRDNVPSLAHRLRRENVTIRYPRVLLIPEKKYPIR